jgi:tRNA-specific 2-thiouridylase
VQIRAHAEPVPASAVVREGTVTVRRDALRRRRPGQTAVLYDGTRVIGQFTVDRTVSAVPVAG